MEPVLNLNTRRDRLRFEAFGLWTNDGSPEFDNHEEYYLLLAQQKQKSKKLRRIIAAFSAVVSIGGLIFGLYTYSSQVRYQRDYNTFQIQLEFTNSLACRFTLKEKWAAFRDWDHNNTPIPETEWQSLFDDDEVKRAILQAVVQTLNYYEAICTAYVEGLIDQRSLKEQFWRIIGRDYKELSKILQYGKYKEDVSSPAEPFPNIERVKLEFSIPE